ncbi:MAG TPA: LPS export ABC transporter permease LptG [Povalibacter sp.]|uniref:LPS export ABC transporter permease LptG n=1 Tax=Povalibacter sp. TaxID=1962978 RepID=UPI002C5AAA24|nr:LPS export ABC transporter permease LptG [Povalibacter sp.]HMN43445.1 LPS export ABC transporter permease LptG [Povalibacter sp.]
MSLLSRYVMRNVIGYTLLVLLVLAVLNGLYLLISQQDEVGVGNYTGVSALMYVGLNLPQTAFDMLPIASLIGALLSLGNLARSLELVVIRAAGVSVVRIGAWVFGAGVLLMAATWALGEYVAPPLEQYAREMKTFQKFQDYSMAGNRAAWAKDGDTILSVQRQSAENSFGGVYVFQFDAQRRLLSVGKAGNASIDKQNRWTLGDYRQSKVENDRIVPEQHASATLETNLSAEFLGLAAIKPDAMPVRALTGYIAHLKRNGLDANSAEAAMWARIARTVAVSIIVVLAVPFAFGPMRSTGTGARTVVGIMVGVLFLLLARLMDSSGAIFDLPPIVVGWTPTVVLALITGVAVSRVR